MAIKKKLKKEREALGDKVNKICSRLLSVLHCRMLPDIYVVSFSFKLIIKYSQCIKDVKIK